VDTSGFDGDWCRINITLPINDDLEIRAAERVIDIARKLYGGATHSLVRPHAFVGYWWDKDENVGKGGWIEDKICWLILDAFHHISRAELSVDAELLRLETEDIYFQSTGERQKEVWIIVHQSWKSV